MPTDEGQPHGAAPRGTPPAQPNAAAGSPDDIFSSFVQHANSEWIASVERVLMEEDAALVAGPITDADDDETDTEESIDPEGTDRVVLLMKKKSEGDDETTVRRPIPSVPRPGVEPSSDELALPDDPPEAPRSRPKIFTRPRDEGTVVEPWAAARAPQIVTREAEEWASVVRAPSETTQRREALKLVPDVASVPPPPIPPSEGSEDGLIPSGELDRKLNDMAVLLRYGHDAQVRGELEALRTAYPSDLLLLRRIAEFYVAYEQRVPALDALFTLASGLFERRNVEGMRQALEQVRVLDPQNGRALRLLLLLDQRPAPEPPPRKK